MPAVVPGVLKGRREEAVGEAACRHCDKSQIWLYNEVDSSQGHQTKHAFTVCFSRPKTLCSIQCIATLLGTPVQLLS